MTPRERSEECVAADAELCDLTDGTHRRLVERIEAAIIAASAISDIHGEAWAKDRHARVQELQGQLAVVERDHDDYARLVEVWRKRSDSKADRIAELEETLNGLCEHTLTAINRLTTLGYYGSASVLNEARNQACAALSGAPAHPATAAKFACCEACGYQHSDAVVCKCGRLAAPPFPAAREAEQCEGCGHVQHRSSCATVLPGDLGNVCGCNAVISSNRKEAKSGVAAFFGMWPGNETDEEMDEALHGDERRAEAERKAVERVIEVARAMVYEKTVANSLCISTISCRPLPPSTRRGRASDGRRRP